MTGDSEPEVWDDNLLFSETLFLALSCLPCFPSLQLSLEISQTIRETALQPVSTQNYSVFHQDLSWVALGQALENGD